MKFIKKLFGIDKIEQTIEHANKVLAAAESRTIDAIKEAEEAVAITKAANEAAEQAKLNEEQAKLTPKERATRKGEPWVGVLDTHINKDNVRNGFFELDWNEPFVLKLKQEGYGADGDKEEEIIDRWFRELCANVVVDGDFGGPVDTGVIDIASVKRNNK